MNREFTESIEIGKKVQGGENQDDGVMNTWIILLNASVEAGAIDAQTAYETLQKIDNCPADLTPIVYGVAYVTTLSDGTQTTGVLPYDVLCIPAETAVGRTHPRIKVPDSGIYEFLGDKGFLEKIDGNLILTTTLVADGGYEELDEKFVPEYLPLDAEKFQKFEEQLKNFLLTSNQFCSFAGAVDSIQQIEVSNGSIIICNTVGETPIASKLYFEGHYIKGNGTNELILGSSSPVDLSLNSTFLQGVSITEGSIVTPLGDKEAAIFIQNSPAEYGYSDESNIEEMKSVTFPSSEFLVPAALGVIVAGFLVSRFVQERRNDIKKNGRKNGKNGKHLKVEKTGRQQGFDLGSIFRRSPEKTKDSGRVESSTSMNVGGTQSITNVNKSASFVTLNGRIEVVKSGSREERMEDYRNRQAMEMETSELPENDMVEASPRFSDNNGIQDHLKAIWQSGNYGPVDVTGIRLASSVIDQDGKVDRRNPRAINEELADNFNQNFDQMSFIHLAKDIVYDELTEAMRKSILQDIVRYLNMTPDLTVAKTEYEIFTNDAKIMIAKLSKDESMEVIPATLAKVRVTRRDFRAHFVQLTRKGDTQESPELHVIITRAHKNSNTY